MEQSGPGGRSMEQSGPGGRSMEQSGPGGRSMRQSLDRPIIVVGAPRSGTTLLASILGAHPDVALIGEPRLVWRYGNDRRSDELRPEHARPPVVDHIRASFAAVLAERGATRLVEKTPANALRPGFVDAVFPDARFLHVTRDGWAAVASMRDFWERRGGGFDRKQADKLGRRLREARPSQMPFYAGELLRRLRPGRHVPLYGPRLAGLQAVADELGYLEAAALQWRACVDHTATFGRSLTPERYLEVRLESLDTDGMAAVVDFCGLPTSAEVLDRFRRDYRADAARRRAPLAADEREVVAPYVVPVNAWLGYDDRVPVRSVDAVPTGP